MRDPADTGRAALEDVVARRHAGVGVGSADSDPRLRDAVRLRQRRRTPAVRHAIGHLVGVRVAELHRRGAPRRPVNHLARIPVVQVRVRRQVAVMHDTTPV